MNNEQTISKEDLFKERIELSKRVEELVLETERLNKIIDELEKVINECSIIGEYESDRTFIEKDYLLNKLKELKGEGNKDE